MASSHSYNTGLHRHRNHGLAPSPNITIYNTTPAHDTSHEIRDAELAETEMLRVIESQEWRYWTSIERHRVPSTNWIVIHQIIVAISKATDDLRAWIRLYGLAGGAAVMIFGKKSVWEVETKVLGDPGAAPALEFKKIIEDESGRIGISGAIITQAAFTGLSLQNMDQTHWTARAACIFSLVSALLAVYFAGSQVWTMGRLSNADNIRSWIRGSKNGVEHIINEPKSLTDQLHFKSILRSLVPTPSSVLTLSAPRLLLSAALKFLLIGLGIYLGFLWTKKPDISTAPNDNRNVFMIYLVGLVLCYGVYTLSGLDQDERTSATVRTTLARSLAKFQARLQKSMSKRRGRRANGKDKVGWGREQEEDELAQQIYELRCKKARLEQERGWERGWEREVGRECGREREREWEDEENYLNQKIHELELKRKRLKQEERQHQGKDFTPVPKPLETKTKRWEMWWDRKRREKRQQQEEERQREWEQQRAEEIRKQLKKGQERQERQALEQRVRELERQLLEARPEQEKRKWALIKRE